MALNQTSSDLAENEQKILNAGRIPYESFKVRDFPPPLPPLPGYLGWLWLKSVSLSFFLGGGRRKFDFYRTQSLQYLA